MNERRDTVDSTAVVISDLSIVCTPGSCSAGVAAGAWQSGGPVAAVGRRCRGRHTAGSFVYCHLTCQGACSQGSKSLSGFASSLYGAEAPRTPGCRYDVQ